MQGFANFYNNTVKVVAEHFWFCWSKNFDYNRNKFHIGFTESRVRPKIFTIGLYFLSFLLKNVTLHVASLPLQNVIKNLDGNGSFFTCILNTFPNSSKMDKLSYRTSYLLHSTWEGTFLEVFQDSSLGYPQYCLFAFFLTQNKCVPNRLHWSS